MHYSTISVYKWPLTWGFGIHTVCVETGFKCNVRLARAPLAAVDEHAVVDLTAGMQKR